MEDQEFARLSKAVAQAKTMCDIDPVNEMFKKDLEDAIAEYQKAKGKTFYSANTCRIFPFPASLSDFYFLLPMFSSSNSRCLWTRSRSRYVVLFYLLRR
jgi:hypothetical protein